MSVFSTSHFPEEFHFVFYSVSFERNWNAERMVLCFFVEFTRRIQNAQMPEISFFYQSTMSYKGFPTKYKKKLYNVIPVFTSQSDNEWNLRWKIIIRLVGHCKHTASLSNNKHPVNWIISYFSPFQVNRLCETYWISLNFNCKQFHIESYFLHRYYLGCLDITIIMREEEWNYFEDK